MARRSLQVSRKALLPKVLSVQGAELALRAPFKSPHPNAPARSEVRASRSTNPLRLSFRAPLHVIQATALS